MIILILSFVLRLQPEVIQIVWQSRAENVRRGCLYCFLFFLLNISIICVKAIHFYKSHCEFRNSTLDLSQLWRYSAASP